MAEVQVAFFTLEKGNRTALFSGTLLKFDLKQKTEIERGDLHDRAFLPCGYAGGSSTSAGAGSAFHRSRMDMASHPCGLIRGRGDEQPKRREQEE